jgi:hypothetical protein
MPFNVRFGNGDFETQAMGLLKAIASRQARLMSALDNLDTAIAKLSADFTKFATDNSAAIDALKAAVAAQDPTRIDAATAKLADLDAQLGAMDDAVRALVPPPAPPAAA